MGFGALLRSTRRSVGVSALAVAVELGVSRQHVERVEIGLAHPLSPLQCQRVALFLGVDARPLVQASVRQRGLLCLTIDDEVRGELAADLCLRWSALTPEQAEAIRRLVAA